MVDSGEPMTGVEERFRNLEEEVRVLSETVRQMTVTVRHLAEQGTSPPPMPAAEAQAEREDAEVSEELAAWVRWLVRRYELDDIPECWAEHGKFVEELESLWIGWQATIGQGLLGMEGMNWHDLAGRTFERMQSMWRTCIDGTHRPWTVPEWADDARGVERHRSVGRGDGS